MKHAFAPWQTGWDSNPRKLLHSYGFQDRYHKPLEHPSILATACIPVNTGEDFSPERRLLRPYFPGRR